MSIQITSLSKSYKSVLGSDVVGLAPVSLSLRAGELVSIVGRSGCGKSTLLRLIAGLEKPSSGRVTIDGNAVTRPPASVRYLFQNFGESLLPWRTVGNNVRFGLRYSYRPVALPGVADADEAIVERLLDEVGLLNTSTRYPAELSGGMQQRVAIARALAANPEVLLLDEPFSAVDALSRATLQDLLLGVWQRHALTVVFVTHDIDEALYLSDRVVVLAPRGEGIRMDLSVPVPRPRDQIATRQDPTFLALRRGILSYVLSE